MTDYKLVPVEPTPEMVEAAESAYMPFGDMELAIRMAVLAAPAVQGEPVGWQYYHDGKWWRRASYPRVYTAPQPAEQQSCPEDIREGAPYDDPDFESLCREHEIWGTAAAAQCAEFWRAGKRAAEQQPALAKYQPCGCVICTCEHETQCQGCGAHHCGTHPVGQFHGPVYQQPAQDVAALIRSRK